MLQLTGTFGKFALIGGDRRVLDLNLETSVQFFKDIAIKKTDVVANALGIYSFLPVGRYGKAKMTSLSVPKNLLQTRKNCATWNPKGKVFTTTEQIDTTPIEYMGEQCTDGLMGDCLEYVLGVGNEVRDITATPEGRVLWAKMIENLYLGLGNSFYDLISFGGSDLITDSDNSDWWDTTSMTEAEWADFKDQNLDIPLKGHMTLIEDVKALGASDYPHFNVDIPSGDVSGDTYTGSDVTTIFDNCLNAATSRFRILLKRNRGTVPASFLVSRSMFNGYKDHLISTYGSNIPDAYFLKINGEAQRGVLMYDGLPVICMDEWTEFDETIGVNTHRVVLTSMGNMVVAHDVPALEQFGGIGLRIEQSQRLRDKGLVDMYTTFRIGTALADTDFMVNASRVLTP